VQRLIAKANGCHFAQMNWAVHKPNHLPTRHPLRCPTLIVSAPRTPSSDQCRLIDGARETGPGRSGAASLQRAMWAVLVVVDLDLTQGVKQVCAVLDQGAVKQFVSAGSTAAIPALARTSSKQARNFALRSRIRNLAGAQDSRMRLRA
jgi:hypothetical protein